MARRAVLSSIRSVVTGFAAREVTFAERARISAAPQIGARRIGGSARRLVPRTGYRSSIGATMLASAAEFGLIEIGVRLRILPWL